MTRSAGSSIVSKCAKIVDVLTEARKPLAFSEIVEATGFVKSSAHRVLAVLLSERMAEYDPHNRTYSSGLRINQWARASWLRADLQILANRELERLCDLSQMNIALSVLDHDSILYIKTLDSIRMRFAARPGDHAPLHCTAAGKVFLALMPEKRRAEIFEAGQFQKYTDNTIVSPELLLEELDRIRERGYGVAVQEEIPHVIGIAAPVVDSQNDITACISIWSLSNRSSVGDMRKLVPELIASANRVSAQVV